MKRKVFQIFTTAAILSSCAIGNKGVAYTEMAEPPQIKLENKKLVFSTMNSSESSALLIYKIEVQADKDRKELIVTAKQAALKKHRNTFEVGLDNLGLQDLNGWRINWIDPNGKKTEMTL